jgi:ribosomal-protein-alanine N-acetyltransferase
MSDRVRPARRNDIERILAITDQCRGAAQWRPEHYEALFALGKSGQALFLVVEQNGAVKGLIAGQLAADEWEIENIAVDPALQCTGLGSHLLREFLQCARSRGRAVFLEVRESNVAARKLYQKLDFFEVGRRNSYYQDPKEDAILLKLSF